MAEALRKGAAILAGVIAGGCCIALIEGIGHKILSGEGAFVAAAAGLGAGAFAGSLVATWLARGGRMPAAAVAALLAGLSAANILSFEHPSWFIPAALAALAIGGWAGWRTAPLASRPAHD